jgi:hypothetical protein
VLCTMLEPYTHAGCGGVSALPPATQRRNDRAARTISPLLAFFRTYDHSREALKRQSASGRGLCARRGSRALVCPDLLWNIRNGDTVGSNCPPCPEYDAHQVAPRSCDSPRHNANDASPPSGEIGPGGLLKSPSTTPATACGRLRPATASSRGARPRFEHLASIHGRDRCLSVALFAGESVRSF